MGKCHLLRPLDYAFVHSLLIRAAAPQLFICNSAASSVPLILASSFEETTIDLEQLSLSPPACSITRRCRCRDETSEWQGRRAAMDEKDRNIVSQVC